MAVSDVTARALSGFTDSWRMFARPEFGLLEHDGILAGATGGAVAYCNQAVVFDEPRDPNRALSAAVAYFQERSLPFMVQVPDGSSVAAVAGEHTLVGAARVPFMVLDEIDDSSWRTPPEDLEIRRIGPEDMGDLDRILTESFGMPLESVRAFALDRLISDDAVHMFIGRFDGTAVTTATSIVSGDAAGVFQVGTLEHHRGKGLGNVMTGHAIKAAAARGARISYLQASPMGFPIYEKMGFKTVLWHTMFERPAD
ncbi:MAG: GNAT family N-acetyltransferase [Actinomycetota bacterium]